MKNDLMPLLAKPSSRMETAHAAWLTTQEGVIPALYGNDADGCAAWGEKNGAILRTAERSAA